MSVSRPVALYQVSKSSGVNVAEEVEGGESPVVDGFVKGDWFNAFDARQLLNAMQHKVRTGPPAKPLTRF